MGQQRVRTLFVLTLVSLTCVSLFGCGQAATNVTTANTNTNTNSNSTNSYTSTTSTTTTSVDAREPQQYQATVTLKIQALGNQQTTELPTLTATVAKKDNDRRMEFAMPAGGRVVYLDKGGTNYLVLPDKKQYAELNQDTLGFQVRRMMTPDQIVDQVKNLKGMQLVGDDTYNGRPVTKYKYGSVASTQTQAGQVATESYLYVDKETGLPLHSETVSQSQTGGNVQGYNGVRVITEISDVKTDVPSDLFAEPTSLQKIDSAQVRAQVDMIFNVIASTLAQALNQMNNSSTATTNTTTTNTSPSPAGR